MKKYTALTEYERSLESERFLGTEELISKLTILKMFLNVKHSLKIKQ